MSANIKPIESTVIRDANIWKQIVSEVQKRPSQEVLDRNKKSMEILAEMRR